MRKILNQTYKLALASTLSLSMLPTKAFAKTYERPPQFVLMAFDGSLNLNFWQRSRDFAKHLKADQKTLNYTYFLSGVYWLGEKNYTKYIPPQIAAKYENDENGLIAMLEQRDRDANDPKISTSSKTSQRGRFSDIGFGVNSEDVAQRILQVNLAADEGHEMGSHANGHWDGSSAGKNYDKDDWNFEIKQFINLIFNAFQNNKIKPSSKYPQGYSFDQSQMIGFRAPVLGTSPGLWPALAENGFKYDTSMVSAPTYWPQKLASHNNLWNFPLAQLKIAGTKKNTLSMDYNFYVSQSGGVSQPENKELFKEQMVNTYMEYFNNNYYGNRAPLHIGHHFSQWNGGAYWEAMQEVASRVCGLPEVKCVTNTEYKNWLESLDADVLKAYRNGTATQLAFNSLPRPHGLPVAGELQYKADVKLIMRKGQFFFQNQFDQRANQFGLKTNLELNGIPTQESRVSIDAIRSQFNVGETVVVRASVKNIKGIEINSSSLKIKNLGKYNESIDSTYLEDQLLKGDLRDAHQE